MSRGREASARISGTSFRARTRVLEKQTLLNKPPQMSHKESQTIGSSMWEETPSDLGAHRGPTSICLAVGDTIVAAAFSSAIGLGPCHS